jgi:hypothetical protein
MHMRERGIILVLGLFFVQRYRFLTINQFSRAAGMHRDTASRHLRNLELRGSALSGNACLPGPNPEKGWELLLRESEKHHARAHDAHKSATAFPHAHPLAIYVSQHSLRPEEPTAAGII